MLKSHYQSNCWSGVVLTPDSLNILLVEDNPADAKLIEQLLGTKDNPRLHLTIVEHLREALNCLSETEFDVILLDLVLPDSLGIDTITRVKAQAPMIPIVVLTDWNDRKMAVEAVRAGAQDYLIYKSVERELVMRAICYAIERQRTEQTIRRQAQRERLLGQMIERIRSSIDLQEILQTTVAQVRQFLETDRVLIYRFDSDWSGVVAVESVGNDWSPILGINIQDKCFVATHVPLYQQGRIRATENIYTAGLSFCHIDLLSQFQVKANLVVPLKQGERLWGLLIAHHCSRARQWQQWEVDFLKQLADRVAIALQQSELYRQLKIANQQLQRLATTDGLTGVANRRRFDEAIELESQRAIREQISVSILLCDIDFFKLYNDNYGHPAGDSCLQKIAQAIAAVAQRPADLVARYGGEEFAVILPKTDGHGALSLARKIQEKIATLKLDHVKSPVSEYVTLSIGIATVSFSQMTPKDRRFQLSSLALVQEADKALYQAKDRGRNCVFQTLYTAPSARSSIPQKNRQCININWECF